MQSAFSVGLAFVSDFFSDGAVWNAVSAVAALAAARVAGRALQQANLQSERSEQREKDRDALALIREASGAMHDLDTTLPASLEQLLKASFTGVIDGDLEPGKIRPILPALARLNAAALAIERGLVNGELLFRAVGDLRARYVWLLPLLTRLEKEPAYQRQFVSLARFVNEAAERRDNDKSWAQLQAALQSVFERAERLHDAQVRNIAESAAMLSDLAKRVTPPAPPAAPAPPSDGAGSR